MVAQRDSIAVRRLGPNEADVRVYMSFDLVCDEDLHDRLLEQSRERDSGFEIVARSEVWTMKDSWDEVVRRRIRSVDEVIVVCGEHTGSSPGMSAELRIAREEQKPYFLLWGRRESMCSRPSGATHSDSMYSWTRQILQDKILSTLQTGPRRKDRKQS